MCDVHYRHCQGNSKIDHSCCDIGISQLCHLNLKNITNLQYHIISVFWDKYFGCSSLLDCSMSCSGNLPCHGYLQSFRNAKSVSMKIFGRRKNSSRKQIKRSLLMKSSLPTHALRHRQSFGMPMCPWISSCPSRHCSYNYVGS